MSINRQSNRAIFAILINSFYRLVLYKRGAAKMPGKDAITTIQISQQIRDKLKELGKKGETYDEVIAHLLKELKK